MLQNYLRSRYMRFFPLYILVSYSFYYIFSLVFSWVKHYPEKIILASDKDNEVLSLILRLGHQMWNFDFLHCGFLGDIKKRTEIKMLFTGIHHISWLTQYSLNLKLETCKLFIRYANACLWYWMFGLKVPNESIQSTRF